MSPPKKILANNHWQDFGAEKPFGEILERQRALRMMLAKAADRRAIFILTGTHEPTVTLGYRANWKDDLRLSRATLRRRGITTITCERGGRATYHGPSQLMFYVVMHLPSWNLRVSAFTRLLEEVGGRFLTTLGVKGVWGGALEGGTAGLWVPQGKLASIGLHLSHGISIQGMCLNLAADLQPFSWIIPCGAPGERMTSVAEVIGKPDFRLRRRLWGRALAQDFFAQLA